ncbi:SDR family NAD(P)-dependent oxidoreductase [Hahella ganghwensis]|uniref:SDR family NAD(P)-dependent oxidoreductase n=1 Tax=Hahella ganghwensis TaxID=286420 RepID=UPI00036F3803|nr:SDR family NAD(P)-dependent oxidoreductase [Hahella ganghwensis]
MSRRIMITGGAGFIGSRLVQALIKENAKCRIWILDSLLPQVHGQNPEFDWVSDQVEFIRGDVSDKEIVNHVVDLAKPEVVYHLAAETGTGQSYDEVARYCEVNVQGTANLIEAVRKYSGKITTKIVLAASRAVYGEGGYRASDGRVYVGLPRQPETMRAGDFSVPLPLDAPLPAKAVASSDQLAPAPASIYASTKLMQEYLLKQAGEGDAWSAVILRFQNVYGPGQSLRNPYTGVLSIFARQLLEGKRLSIYEDGKIMRDFVYVDDVVNALVKSGICNLIHGSTIDIGSGEAVTICDVANLLIRNLGETDEGYAITGEFRVGDIRHACADISSAQKFLDWSPSVGIERGITELSEWARQQFEIGQL